MPLSAKWALVRLNDEAVAPTIFVPLNRHWNWGAGASGFAVALNCATSPSFTAWLIGSVRMNGGKMIFRVLVNVVLPRREVYQLVPAPVTTRTFVEVGRRERFVIPQLVVPKPAPRRTVEMLER